MLQICHILDKQDQIDEHNSNVDNEGLEYDCLTRTRLNSADGGLENLFLS